MLFITYPNHSCVQHQVSTAFQDQHSIYLLKKGGKNFVFQSVQIIKHNDFQLLKKCACIYLHWSCILCLYVGDGAKDELGFIITLLKLYTSKYSNEKRNTLLIYATTSTDLKGIILTVKSQFQKVTYCMIPVIKHFQMTKL